MIIDVNNIKKLNHTANKQDERMFYKLYCNYLKYAILL